MKSNKDILVRLEANLELIETEVKDVLIKSEKGIKEAKFALEQLRNYINKTNFKKASTEIDFFKNVKPQVFSKLIYYVKLFNIESKSG